jgi:NAD(P)-dependent dehydrogenase (short-subunit alcohol dehydrogenase family)
MCTGTERGLVLGHGWTAEQIPNQTGRRALVTGANSGIGFYAALELAHKGARVLLGARDRTRGEAAVAKIRAEVPNANIELLPLDLASLKGIRAVAEALLARGEGLDLLINNAGVMAPKTRELTADGFEMQFGVNVLGHFALTAWLMPALELAAQKNGPPPRIVTIASIAHKRGRIDFDDLQSEKHYDPMAAYRQSKLANLMLALELDHRLRANGSRVMSVAAHPGVAQTPLFLRSEHRGTERLVRLGLGIAIRLFLNTAPQGAVPTLFAATAPEASSGGYYGPQGYEEMRGGDVGPAIIAQTAQDRQSSTRLWHECERLTGTRMLD